MSTATLERTEIAPLIQNANAAKFRHYFYIEDIDASFLHGQVVTAICGYQQKLTSDWDRWPVCKKCVALYELMDN